MGEENTVYLTYFSVNVSMRSQLRACISFNMCFNNLSQIKQVSHEQQYFVVSRQFCIFIETFNVQNFISVLLFRSVIYTDSVWIGIRINGYILQEFIPLDVMYKQFNRYIITYTLQCTYIMYMEYKIENILHEFMTACDFLLQYVYLFP